MLLTLDLTQEDAFTPKSGGKNMRQLLLMSR